MATLEERRTKLQETKNRIAERQQQLSRRKRLIDRAGQQSRRDTKSELRDGGLRGRDIRRQKRVMRNRLPSYRRSYLDTKQRFQEKMGVLKPKIKTEEEALKEDSLKLSAMSNGNTTEKEAISPPEFTKMRKFGLINLKKKYPKNHRIYK